MDTDPCTSQAGTSTAVETMCLKKHIAPQKLSGSTMTWASYLFTSQDHQDPLFENLYVERVCKTQANDEVTDSKAVEEPEDNHVYTEYDYGSCCSWTWCGCDQFYHYNFCDHSCKCEGCAECLLYGGHYKMEVQFDALFDEVERKSRKSRLVKPGAEMVNKRIQGVNGSILRGVDLRHLPKWVDQPTYFMTKFMKPPKYVDEKGKLRKELKALEFNVPERQNLVTEEAFGMNSYSVPYTLGKRSRWTLGEFFEENSTEFQHPDQNITTVLMTSNNLPKPQELHSEQFPPLINGIQASFRVKRLIGAEANGQVYTKESRSGKALPVDLIKPVAPLPRPSRQQPKHKKASRRFRRKEMLRKKVECQEAPIRLTYLIAEPRPTTRQLASDGLRQKFTSFLHGKKCPRPQKHRSLLIQPEDEISYNETMDFEIDGTFEDEGFEDYRYKSPTGMCLSDFIQDDDMPLTPAFVFVNHENGDFSIIGPKQTRRPSEASSTISSIGSYELVEEYSFEN